MNSVGGVATDTRFSQHFSQLSNTIINESEFPSLGARTTPLGGGYSPLPTTSGAAFPTAQSSPFKDGFLPNHRNYANLASMTNDYRTAGDPSGRGGPVPVLGAWANNGGTALNCMLNSTLMRSDPSLSNPEFQIQNEDFPALPGAGLPNAGVGSDLASHVPISLVTSAAEAFSTVSSMDPFAPHAASAASSDPPRGIVTHPEGEVSNIPPSMLNDQFGMAGLVTYLRTVDNPSIVSLALGYDLTTLGLNLNVSERHLYTTFGGPWADNPIRPHELDVKVPDEYLTNTHIREKLPAVKLNKLSEDVLFYLFYNCPNEVYQLAAACELYQRDWRYHKSEGVWLTRSQYGGVKEQTGSYEKGQYNVFDQMQWRKIPKELKLEYKELEDRPKLPAIFAGIGNSTLAAMAGLNNGAPTTAGAAGATATTTTTTSATVGTTNSGPATSGGAPSTMLPYTTQTQAQAAASLNSIMSNIGSILASSSSSPTTVGLGSISPATGIASSSAAPSGVASSAASTASGPTTPGNSSSMLGLAPGAAVAAPSRSTPSSLQT